MARPLSVNVGLPRDIEWKGRTVHTGIWKDPVRGRCRAGRLNLEGDGQGDLAGHGGEQRAVFVYQIDSYRYWQDQLKRTDLVHGQFGENFTVEGKPLLKIVGTFFHFSKKVHRVLRLTFAPGVGTLASTA